MNLIKYIEKINDGIGNNFSGKSDLENIGISELHMHKILFHLYGAFYKHFNKELFNANFEAWKYGPVEINYRKIIKNKTNENNYFKLSFSLSEEERIYLDELIVILLKKSAWTLVELSHRIPAWKNNFRENKNHCKIPNNEIKESFLRIEI